MTAVKTLLQHIALANRDWLPAGVLPAAHLQQTQALLHTLTGQDTFTRCHLCMQVVHVDLNPSNAISSQLLMMR